MYHVIPAIYIYLMSRNRENGKEGDLMDEKWTVLLNKLSESVRIGLDSLWQRLRGFWMKRLLRSCSASMRK